MSDNNKLPKQAKSQEFELVELLFGEYISSHIARPDIEYSFQARFQSFINQTPSYLHSVSKIGFFTHFFFGSFASLLDTQLAGKLGIQKLYFNFESADHLRIVVETNDKIHVFIFKENNQNKKQKKNKDIDFTKDEWKTITGREYTEDDNKKLEISVIQINKSTGSINVTVEKKDIQEGASSTKQYRDITKQCLDKDGQYVALEDQISKLSLCAKAKSIESLDFILKYTKLIHDHYQGLPYGDKAREADEHGFVAGIFNNFKYRENVHGYLEQFAGTGYADMVLLVRGSDRTTKSIPIIMEFKAGTGAGTNADDALKQVEEYTKGFQPNNMRILSLADNILCVGMNLDSPSDSFMQMKVVVRDQEVIPVVQQIINQLVTEEIINQNPAPDDLIVIQQTIKQYLKKTYNTFPGTGEKSSAHYMSRFLLGESLVLRDYDKHIVIYDKESYILPTATVIDDHGTRSKKPKIEKIVDGSNAVNSILFIPTSSADAPVISVNIIDVNRDVVVKNIRLDSELIGNRKIVQLNIQFNIDKYKESFEEYCKIHLLKIYGSISEYNQASIEAKGQLYRVSEEVSDNLSEHLQQAISAQEGLVIAESWYKELMGKVGGVVYPIKSLIGRESEFQGLLEGIFKYYSDTSLSEGAERRVLVLTEFQTGAGGRIDMLMQAIGPSEQGTKEYVPVGLELKYDDSIYLRSSDKSKSAEEQVVLLNDKAKHVVEKLLQDQTERYSKGAAIKSITDGNKVAIMGIVFNARADQPGKLFLTTDKFLEADIVHSSKVYSISFGDELLDIMNFAEPDNIRFMPDWFKMTLTGSIADDQIIDLSNTGINDQKSLKSLLLAHGLNKIEGLDLSYNTLTDDDLKGLSTMFHVQRLAYLDFSDNDLGNSIEDVKQLIGNGVETLKINDIGADNAQLSNIVRYLKGNNNLINLDVADLDSEAISMSQDTATRIAEYLEDNTTLEYLSLVNAKIDDLAAIFLSGGLDRNQGLRELILTNNLITNVGASNIASTFRNNNLVKIDLSGNPLGITGVDSVVRAAHDNDQIQELSLINVGLEYNPKVSNDQMLEIMSLLFSNPNLRKVNIAENDIGDGALRKIFSTLKDNIDTSTLEELSLAGNKIDVGVTDLSMYIIAGLIKDYISCSKYLRSLDLSSMNMKDEIGEEIVKGLEGNTGLMSLDLSGNANGNVKIGTKTLSQLAQVLPNNQYLKYLNLADNHLSVRDLNILIGGVQTNTVLSHLNLSGNDFTTQTMINDHGRVHIDIQSSYIDFNRLLQDTGLKYLNLANCKLNQSSISSLFQGLENNDILEILDIRGNILDDTIINDIVEALIKNAAQDLNGLKQLYIDKSHLSDESILKLLNQSLGISVLIDDDLQQNTDLSTELEKMEIEPTCPIKSLYDNNLDKYNGYVTEGTLGPVFETAIVRDDDGYWLQDHDVTHIARVHYQNTNVQVLSTSAELSHILKEYRASKDTSPFTIIINVNSQGGELPESGVGNHWVSLVLQRVNNHYDGYYVDSFGHSIASGLAELLNAHHIRIHDIGIHSQQHDSYNCGLWALENAQAMRNVLLLTPNSDVAAVQNSLPTSHNEEYFRNLRNEIWRELMNDDARVEFLNAYGINVDILRRFSNNDDHLLSQYHDTAAGVIACLMTAHFISQSKHKREILKVLPTNSPTVVDGKSFLDCTDKLTTYLPIAQLIKILNKFQIRDDGTCVRVNDFIMEQEIIDAIKKEIPDIAFNMHLIMKNTSAMISMAAATHNIQLFKVVCTRYGKELKAVIDVEGKTLLHQVMHYKDAKEWAALVIDHGISIDTRDLAGNTALYYAILNRNDQVVGLLIARDANVDSVNNEGQSLLLSAIINSANNNYAIAELLLKYDANINILNNNNTALYLSVLKNDTRITEFLLDHKANVNIHNNGNDTALAAAIRMNNKLMIDLLLQHGANVTAPGYQGNTPIIIATAVKNKELVKKLIESGADVNATNDDGYSAISIAVGGGAVTAGAGGIIGYLGIGEGSILSWLGSTARSLASGILNRAQGYSVIESSIDNEISELLTDHGAELNTVNNFGSTPLHYATQNQNYEMIESFLEHRANIDTVNSDGDTALHISTNQLRYRGRRTRAIDNNDDDIVKKIIHLLIKKNAQVDINNKRHETAIYLAVIKENKEIIELYLNHVKDSTILLDRAYNDNKSVLEHVLESKDSEIISQFIRFQDQEGKSILSAAVLINNQAAINLLVQHKADINIQDGDGNTPLHLAMHSSNTKVIKYLIDKGTRLDIKNKAGNAAVHLAVKNHDSASLVLLKAKNADFKLQDNDGNTALHLALKRMDQEVIALLLSFVDDGSMLLCIENQNGDTILKLALMSEDNKIISLFVNFHDSMDSTALHLAVKHNKQDIIDLLIANTADINIQDGDGNTPLHLAAQIKNIQIFQLLLDNNVTLNLKNKDNKTAFDVAKAYGMDIIKFQLPIPSSYKDHNIEDITIRNQDLENSYNHHKHRYHHGEGNEKAEHHIGQKHTGDNQRGRRDIEDALHIKYEKQYDNLVSRDDIGEYTDIRLDAIVQVQNAMGTQHRIEQDVSKFIGSKASPVVNSVPNQLLVDWQGNLLLWYLLFGQKCSGAKCKITKDVVEPKDLEYAQRLAYSAYAPVIGDNAEYTE
ncbi:MAG TPA: ankyrin repeat domain-containing protein [Rickettsia endosymbiont of Diachasma alloeum]|nr:ankyrin repeat domain-containing protein [Rickettsia endosymbiont of Diachasma alloeum]